MSEENMMTHTHTHTLAEPAEKKNKHFSHFEKTPTDPSTLSSDWRIPSGESEFCDQAICIPSQQDLLNEVRRDSIGIPIAFQAKLAKTSGT